MKLFRLFIGLCAVSATLFSLNSCKKSYKCCNAGDCETINQSDFDSKDEFNSYIKYLERNGYTCK